MPLAYDLINERGGSILVETIEACDEDAAWRAGLMLHIEALRALVCLQGRIRPRIDAG